MEEAPGNAGPAAVVDDDEDGDGDDYGDGDFDDDDDDDDDMLACRALGPGCSFAMGARQHCCFWGRSGQGICHDHYHNCDHYHNHHYLQHRRSAYQSSFLYLSNTNTNQPR